ncbi:DUF3102 domain-containing protein [Bradyrhizobium canariense]|uniref:DUF3102 domain-containing protein n=1 Tax=Bradyrhizobium canariense TaxID=255045 RepID=UPI001B8A1195|nr:DUF3102 domain-containing protein [Bradyrhizobium canariense]MBR0955331.1 DUF3102 domain-containing protein [Bradyrhizobium canariense]
MLGNDDMAGTVEKYPQHRIFDYRDLSAPVAAFLKGQAERIRRQATLSVINIGRDLASAKQYVSHGAFIAWVESEIGIPARTAQAYMRLAKWAPPKNSKIGHLPISLLYLLSASTTPDEFVADVLTRLAAGECITTQAVRDELRNLRETSEGTSRDSRRRRFQRPDQNGSCERDHGEVVTSDFDVEMNSAALLEAVTIFAHRLPSQDFVRVQDILTDRITIEDPDLPQKIMDAFSTFERQRSERSPFGRDGLHESAAGFQSE